MLVLNADKDSDIMFLAVPPAGSLHSSSVPSLTLSCKLDTR